MNGKNHDRGILIGTTVLIAASLPLNSLPITLSLAIGNTIGGLWLSPDLDLAHSQPSRRWGWFAWYWDVDRLLCGRHRSWLSHWPFVGTIGRLLYIGWPALVFDWWRGWDDLWIAGIIIGVFISEAIHLGSDFLADHFVIGK
jgi:uncharacterized metal-binding protein